MKNCFFIALFLGIFSVELTAQISRDTLDIDAQDAFLDSLDTEAQSHFYVELGGNYTSIIAYNGRTEGVIQYGLSPSIVAHLGKGWAVNYSGDYWSATTPKFAFSTVGVSKNFDMGKTGSCTIGYSRWISHTTDVSQKSDYTGSLDIDLHWDLGNFTVGNAAYLLLGSSRALYLSPYLGYDWSGRLGKSRLWKWSVNPALVVDLGNDVPTRLGNKATKRPGRGNAKTRFGLLNVDASLSASIGYKRSSVSFTYHYDLPQNTVAPNPINAFNYFEVSVNQWFNFKN
jgi:hypothetical protein